MSSIAAKNVGEEVLETVGKGKRPNVSKIGVKHGYSPKTAAAGRIQQTKSYKGVILPFLKRLEKHREKVIAAMEAKDLNEEQYKTLNDGLAKLNHDIQLLSGGSTEDIKISWE